MFALEQFLIGIAIAHAAWLYFYICGTLLRRPRSEEKPSEALLSVVVASASGMALTGLATFALGQFGLIRPLGLVLWLALVLIAFIVRGDSPLKASFWSSRFRSIRTAFMSPAIVIYLVGLADALPAMLPDRMFDSFFYYSVLANDYATSHYQMIDEWVRGPYYANNWVLVETWLWVLRAGDFVGFLTWLTGLLTLLAIFALVWMQFDSPAVSLHRKRFVAFVIASGSVAALLLNPAFLWLNSGGMIDVQLGLFFLIPAICCYLSLRNRDMSFVPSIVVTAAFLVGAKISFVAFLPLFFLAILVVVRSSGGSRKMAATAALVLVVLSSPWYVENLVLDGDPIPPILNMAFRGHDPNYTKEDIQQQTASLSGEKRGPAERLTLPADMFTNTDPALVSDGETAICFLLMLPAAILLFGLLSRRVSFELATFAALVSYAIAYWLLTSYHARYALIYYPALCAFVGVVLARFVIRAPRFAIEFCIVALLLAIPSPSSASWMRYFWNLNFVAAPSIFTNRERFLAERIPGYSESRYVATEFHRLHRPYARAYGLQLEMLKYPFGELGVTEVGDWFGAQGYRGLDAAVDRGAVAAYLKGLDVEAVIIPERVNALTEAQRTQFVRQLVAAGYSLKICPSHDGTVVYLHNDPAAPACAT